MADVFINGKYIGDVDNPKLFCDSFRSERRKGNLPVGVTIFYNEDSDSVHIFSSSSRLMRPLIVVKDGMPLLTQEHLKQIQKGELSWDDLVRLGIIEYLDAAEEENALIAFSEEELTDKHTHLEISPLVMLGLAASLVPYGNYNQSARLLIGTKNQKQGIGLYVKNYLQRMDTDVNLLHYPQTPIVRSVIHDIINYDQHPSGQNVVVAVMSYEGYNIEDAILINRASIERGFARSTYYRPYVAEEMRYSGGFVDKICIPDKDVKGYRTEQDYKKLNEDGIIYPEADVKEGDVLIGKTSPPRFLSPGEELNLMTNVRRESSVSVRHGESGIVDFVLITESEEGNKLVQVRVREEKIPEIGDKFTSRHGQKGVVGMILPLADMPFTANGIVPDIIFSPHSIPSRMTIAHLLEMIAGKVGALDGRFVYGTSFDPENEKDLRELLIKLGFRENGVETMYNGMTGKQFKARIFIGNIYYMKLKYLVSNKIHSRARGPVQLLTRQPTEGRAKEGGLRLGEMEKDTFVAHGASLVLKERFDSDRTVVPVCEECGHIAYYNHFNDRYVCPICGESAKITNIEISYAFKLIIEELKALGIVPRIKLKTKY